MLTTIVGLVVVLCAAVYVAWPLLAPAEPDEPVSGDGAAPDEHSPEKEKDLALHAIKEAEFDHQTGKLSDEDYAALRAELETRALHALAEIEAASALHAVGPAAGGGATPQAAAPARPGDAEPAGFCPACGTRFTRGARFCGGCGKKLGKKPAATKERGRRRA